MKKLIRIIEKRKLMCAALSTIVALGSHTGTYVCAAGTSAGDAQTKDIQAGKMQAANDTQTPVNETASEDTQPVLTDEELAAYYRDSVFVGDSIMVGFRNYSAKQKSFVHDIQFLAVGSYSAFNAMKPVEGDNVHPMYKGKKSQIWNAIPLMDCKRAFILLGMNDISILGLEGARDKYKELIDKILEASPDIEIHIISVTYTLKDQGKGKLNNENLAQYNLLLQEMAEENGWGYLDLCTPISDGEGNLAKEYCSDGFVHLSSSAYTLWETALIDYAGGQASQAAAQTGTDENTSISGSADKADPSQKNTEIQTKDPGSKINALKGSGSKTGTSTEAGASQETKERKQS